MEREETELLSRRRCPCGNHLDRLGGHLLGENLRYRPCPVDKSSARGRHSTTNETDVTFGTAWHELEPHIKKALPGCDLYPVVPGDD